MTIIWIGAALVLGIIELFSVDLFFLALAISAAGGGIAAMLGAPLWVQIVVFAVAALVTLFLIRPWARRHLERTTPNIETNARALVGKKALVLTPLLGPAGRVRLEGEEWSARGVDGAVFPVGSEVRVVAIEGAIAVVGPLDELPGTPSDTFPARH